MSTTDARVPLLPFVSEVLTRDGAAVEQVGPDALFVVPPRPLRAALELPSAATLDLSGTPAAEASAFPLEGAGMQWCIERARARGRRAGAYLSSPPQNPSGRLAKARKRLVLPNATIVKAEATRPVAVRTLLEFGYDAQSEERTEGRVHVAVTQAGVTSVALADALTTAQHAAVPERLALEEDAIGQAARRAAARVEAEVRSRLAPFRADCLRRLEVERDRIVAYHDRLVREAGRQRRARGEATLEARREAIQRQRAERLDDLEERHAIHATHWLASALVVRYEISLCRFRVRRRKREVAVFIEWDPFLGDFLGHPCDACATATFSLHVCDAAAHVTCTTCAARCPACLRVTCRACRPKGCGCAA